MFVDMRMKNANSEFLLKKEKTYKDYANKTDSGIDDDFNMAMSTAEQVIKRKADSKNEPFRKKENYLPLYEKMSKYFPADFPQGLKEEMCDIYSDLVIIKGTEWWSSSEYNSVLHTYQRLVKNLKKRKGIDKEAVSVIGDHLKDSCERYVKKRGNKGDYDKKQKNRKDKIDLTYKRIPNVLNRLNEYIYGKGNGIQQLERVGNKNSGAGSSDVFKAKHANKKLNNNLLDSQNNIQNEQQGYFKPFNTLYLNANSAEEITSKYLFSHSNLKDDEIGEIQQYKNNVLDIGIKDSLGTMGEYELSPEEEEHPNRYKFSSDKHDYQNGENPGVHEDFFNTVYKSQNGYNFARRSAFINSGDELAFSNILTWIVADKLGLQDIMSKAEVAKILIDGKVQYGSFQHEVAGTTGKEAVSEGKSYKYSSKAIKQLMSLWVLDYICGQADRNQGNIMFDINESDGTIKNIKGIDNDMSFGHEDAENASESMGTTFLITGIKYIDDALFNKIKNNDFNLIKGDLEKAVDDNKACFEMMFGANKATQIVKSYKERIASAEKRYAHLKTVLCNKFQQNELDVISNEEDWCKQDLSDSKTRGSLIMERFLPAQNPNKDKIININTNI